MIFGCANRLASNAIFFNPSLSHRVSSCPGGATRHLNTTVARTRSVGAQPIWANRFFHSGQSSFRPGPGLGQTSPGSVSLCGGGPEGCGLKGTGVSHDNPRFSKVHV